MVTHGFVELISISRSRLHHRQQEGNNPVALSYEEAERVRQVITKEMIAMPLQLLDGGGGPIVILGDRRIHGGLQLIGWAVAS